jgi:hypothetical protein
MSYSDWYEAIQAIKLKPAKAIDRCPGGGFRKPQDGSHYWILVSDRSPEICYYCNAERGRE